MKRPALGTLAAGLLLLGWIARSFWGRDYSHVGSLLEALATLTAAYWIQRALRRQNELDRVPLETIGRFCRRLEDMLGESIQKASGGSPTDPQLLSTLRILSNEIDWLGSICGALNAARPEYQHLLEQYILFKRRLTEGPSCDVVAASRLAGHMRISSLKIQWRLSHRVLDAPDTLQALAT